MRWIVLLIVAVVISFGAIILWESTPVAVNNPEPVVLDQADVPLVGGDFTLVNSDGEPVHSEAWRGKYMLVYFGFTYCPDVCPTGLARISRVMKQLGKSADEVVPLFITVDPERDTPEQLGIYMKNFDPRIIGLTGSPEQIKQAADAYKVYYVKREDDSAMEYLVDHSAFTYLMDRQGILVHHFPHEATAEDMAEAINRRLSAEFKADARAKAAASTSGNSVPTMDKGE